MHRKGLVIGIFILMIGVNIGSTFAGDADVKTMSSVGFDGNTLYVGGSGPNNYTTIQSAIDDAVDGDTVFVYDDSSPYFERILVRTSINLIGENRETTIIDANGSGCPVDLESNGVEISGFTLQNSGNKDYNDAGIHFKNWGEVPYSHNNRIIGNKMINNFDGIFGINSEDNYIADNIIMDNRHRGIFFQAGCTSNIIQNNSIIGNEYGINLQDSNEVQVIENRIENNNQAGVYLFAGADNNYVISNYILNNSNGILFSGGPYGVGWNEISGNNIANNDEYGLLLLGSYWNKIHNNNFIENNVHASFFYELPVKILGFFFGRPLQVNKFYRNYWDDKILPTPKIIRGDMSSFAFAFLLDYFSIEPRAMKWKNFDWFPAMLPYDIGV